MYVGSGDGGRQDSAEKGGGGVQNRCRKASEGSVVEMRPGAGVSETWMTVRRDQ